jgi:hypothetical protein
MDDQLFKNSVKMLIQGTKISDILDKIDFYSNRLTIALPSFLTFEDPKNYIIGLEFLDKIKLIKYYQFTNKKISEYPENMTCSTVKIIFRKLSFEVLKNVRLKGQINKQNLGPKYQKIIDSIFINKDDIVNKYIFIKEDSLLFKSINNNILCLNTKEYVLTRRSFTKYGCFSKIKINMYDINDVEQSIDFFAIKINGKKYHRLSVIEINMKCTDKLIIDFRDSYIYKYFFTFVKRVF